jgi:hypothetical protein
MAATPTLTITARVYGAGLVIAILRLLERTAPLLGRRLTLFLANLVLHWLLWIELRGAKGWRSRERIGQRITATA